MTPRLPLSRAALAAVGALLVTGLGGYFGFIAPRAREIEKLQPQLKAIARQSAAPPLDAVSISDTERVLWDQLQTRVRARFVSADDQPRVLGEVTALAREAGMTVRAIGLEASPAQPTLAPPAPLTANTQTIRLSARHRFANLIAFLESLHRARIYVVVESLETKRVDTELESEIRLRSLRWQQ